VDKDKQWQKKTNRYGQRLIDADKY
jgi:hypothetical protein